MLILEPLYIVLFAVEFYGGINIFLKPSPFLFLHFVIMPRSLINFYLYEYLRYKKKIYIFVNVFLATTVKEDEDYICGELAPKPAHCCCLLYLIQTVLNVECLKNAL